MSLQLPILTPYQEQLKKAHRQRQERYAAAVRQARASRQQVHVSRQTPLWRTSDIRFDAHVRAYQFHLANMAVRPEVAYIKRRCAELGVSYRDVIGRSSYKEIAAARRLLMWEIRQNFKLSFADIGRAFGGRDHATAIGAIKSFETMNQQRLS
ncbi:helix-turn-helix domain-containing protein [Rhizobium sp. RU36D]|uniref:helix-turn-helix domain-containing protein n=1 Tax=Rhizobium sp. RU36D TaxID=1907415 RepID=UPI0009D7E83B|nr:helix-turn-helix domain-containing protein [Rhizobium sp. RU36D]SMC87485.1 dnaA protein helix-turn-helix [Rhizobium sp. RU36D]